MTNEEFICLKNDGIELFLTPIGASVRSLFVKDRNECPRDIVLGYETEEPYLTNSASLGAVVGRYAGRISGARFKLGEKTFELDRNEGRNCLHGGFDRYEIRRFRVASKTNDAVIFELESPDGDQGFPGNALIRVTYTITNDPGLRIDYLAKSDMQTVFNLTNHSYFNLNGHDAGDVSGHTLMLDADSYIELDNEGIPTGRLSAADDTCCNLRMPRQLSNSYDNCFVLNHGDSERPSAQLYGDESGIRMDVYTDRPVMVVYTAEKLAEGNAKDGATYLKRQAVCLESECYPDAMNRPEFPLGIYGPGRDFTTFTEFRFKNGEYCNGSERIVQ